MWQTIIVTGAFVALIVWVLPAAISGRITAAGGRFIALAVLTAVLFAPGSVIAGISTMVTGIAG